MNDLEKIYTGLDLKSINDDTVFYSEEVEMLTDFENAVGSLSVTNDNYSLELKLNDLLVDAVLEVEYAFDEHTVSLYAGINYDGPDWLYNPFFESEKIILLKLLKSEGNYE